MQANSESAKAFRHRKAFACAAPRFDQVRFSPCGPFLALPNKAP